MTDDSRDMLVRGIAAAKANSRDEARFFLEKFLGTDPSVEGRVQAWRYLADLTDDPVKKRAYIGRILAIEPTDGFARRTLAVLDGRLNPAEIVDPDRLRRPSANAAPAASPHRLVCPRCGSGRVVATQGGQRLVCEHCRHEESIARSGADEAVDGRDFAATMWTALGHRTAEPATGFACGGCGASFILTPRVRSLTCPFCGSVHSESESTRLNQIVPDGMIPFAVSAADAEARLEARGEPFSRLSAVYLPAWMFTFAGEARWRGTEDRDTFAAGDVEISGVHTVHDHAALVCAAGMFPENMPDVAGGFDLSAIVPYDPLRVAGHPTVAYGLTLDQASIPARREAVDALSRQVENEAKEAHPGLGEVRVTFGRLGIDSFRLLLLPFWTAEVGARDRRRLFFVNGQTGRTSPS